MLGFIIRRLLVIIPMVLIVVTLTWGLIRLAPGNFYTGEKRIPKAIQENIKKKYGLDRPWYVQYGKMMGNTMRGDFGMSLTYPGQSVNEILKRTLPVSATLGLSAYLLALIVGLTAGTLAALNPNSRLDYGSMGLAMLGISLPNFVLGPLLVLVFSLTLYWLPPARWLWAVGPNEVSLVMVLAFPAAVICWLMIGSYFKSSKGRKELAQWQHLVALALLLLVFYAIAKLLLRSFPVLNSWTILYGIPNIKNVLLPVLTLSAIYMAYIARLSRSGMLEVLRSDYVRTARAKGLRERDVILRHVVRGGIMPVVSFTGPALAFLVTGTVVVERIFALPGLGNYFLNANLARDEPLIIGIVAFISIAILVFNLLVDISYAFIDPRIRY